MAASLGAPLMDMQSTTPIGRLMAALSVWSTEDFAQSFCMVGIAEAFDKTWFVALILAMKAAKLPVFIGCFGGLAVHVIIAAVIGYTASSMINLRYLQLATAALFFTMAGLYTYDWYHADPDADVIESGCADAVDDLGGGDDIKKELNNYGSSPASPKKKTGDLVVMSEAFLAVFIAEWGDRTQIAMFGQHASQPLMPVICGSLLAFALLTTSAVLLAKALSGVRIKEQWLFMIGALSFLVFGFQALYDTMEPAPGVINQVPIRAVHPLQTKPGQF